MKKCLIIMLLLFAGTLSANILQPDTSGRQPDSGMSREALRFSDSLYKAGIYYFPVTERVDFYLLDTIRSDSFFIANFAPFSAIKNTIQDPDYKYQTRKSEIRERLIRNSPWKFILIIIILLLFILVRFTNRKNYREMLGSIFKTPNSSSIYEDKSASRAAFYIETNLIFVLLISLVLYMFYEHYNELFYKNDLLVFLRISGIVLCIYLVKYMVHYVAGSILKAEDAVLDYLLNITTVHFLFTIVLFPVLVFVIYSSNHFFEESLVRISSFVLIGSLAFRYIRGLYKTIEQYNYNIFYLFLYLCTLEISPWFFIVKFLNNYI